MLLWPAAWSFWRASSPSYAACLPWTLAWHCGYTTWPEKISVRGLNGWSDCLKMFSRRLPLIFIWRSVNPLFNFTHPASSFPALSLASTVAHLSAWPRSEASLLSSPTPLRWRRLWWELSYWSCVLPFCERRQRKKFLLPACFACQPVEDSLVTCLVQTDGSPGNYFLNYRLSLSNSTGLFYLSTSLLSHPAIDPPSLCPFATRYPSFLCLWFFPNFLAPCDLVVISRELNGEARGYQCPVAL